MSATNAGHESDDDVPLHHKRPFGAGLKRKRVEFVRASSPDLQTTQPNASNAPSPAADFYRKLVLPDEETSKPGAPKDETTSTALCPLCALPLDAPRKPDDDSPRPKTRTPHEASIAHQVCLAHSHPPSAIDRSRRGLAYLQSQGWDPDSRQGLGVAGQGIQHPLKPKEKNDTLGIGVEIPKEFTKPAKKPRKLNAKECQEMAVNEKRNSEFLRQMIYGHGR